MRATDAAPASPSRGSWLLPIRAPGDPVDRRGLAAATIVIVTFFAFQYENFGTVSNGLTVALNVSTILIAVVGAMVLLVGGYIDLSIGSMFGLIAMITATVAVDSQSAPLAVGVALGLGLALGALNGLLVRRLTINPIIVTLGLLLIYRGIAVALTDARAVFGFPEAFIALGRSTIGPIPIPVVIAIVVWAVGSVLLVATVPGLRTYALGGNAEAARRQGVSLDRHVIGLYAINGTLIGLVAALTAARLGSASPNFGTGLELDVLTAVILGGIGFAGGTGRPTGVLVGVFLIGVLNAGLIFAGFKDYYQQVAKGLVLLLALFADQYSVFEGIRRSLGRRGARNRLTDPDEGGEEIRSLERGLFSGPGATRESTPVLECSGLEARYGSVVALRGAGFAVRPGEVVCLVGDNGAGKSTLIKILSGVERPTGGSIRLDGAERSFRVPSEARDAGIETVYQDLALCPNLSVTHNLVLGAEPRMQALPVFRDDESAERRARGRLDDLGIRLGSYHVPVRLLSGGQRQSVAIARALRPGLKVVIMDEPTASLGVNQTVKVLAMTRRMADQGAGIILISHDVETVFAVADRVVVLRLGEVVHDGPASNLSDLELVQLMAGLKVASAGDQAPRALAQAEAG